MTSNSAVMERKLSTHTLSDKWVLWAHLPHVTDWSNKSYIPIQEISSVEEIVSLYNIIPEAMVKNCMLFLMRKDIFPSWEDPKNRKGGCFSFKVNNKKVSDIWKKLQLYLLVLVSNPLSYSKCSIYFVFLADAQQYYTDNSHPTI